MVIIPCVNPDGVQIALHGARGAGCYEGLATRVSGNDFSRWNANARGVDINHNFDAGWDTLHQMEQESGITGPAPRQYGGDAPESEPETQALVRLCRSQPFRHALAFHSQGEEIFWEYGENTPERGRMMAKIFSASSGYRLVDNLKDTLYALSLSSAEFGPNLAARPLPLRSAKGKIPFP